MSLLKARQSEILQSAYLCEAVYRCCREPGSNSQHAVEHWLRHVTIHQAGNAYAVVGLDFHRNDTAWLVACGTNEVDDWRQNLNTRWTTLKHIEGRLHAGFAGHYLSLSNAIWHDVVSRNVRHLVACGHSLGGAVALLLGVELAQLGGVKTRVITFGAPRVFDDAAALFVDVALGHIVNHVRVENLTDPVPDLPPRRSTKSWSHCGTAIYLGGGGYVATEDQPLLSRFLRTIKRLLGRRFAWDEHNLKTYQRRLAAWKGAA